VDWILLFQQPWILKTFQLLTLEWQDQRFANFFEPYPNLSLVKTPHTTTQASHILWKK